MSRNTIVIIVTLALGLVAAPLAATAQQAGKMPGIGILRGGRADGQFVQDFLEAFRQGLREFGWVEG